MRHFFTQSCMYATRTRTVVANRSRVLSTAAALTVLLAIPLQAGPLIDRANELYSAGNYTSAIAAYRRAAREGETPALCYFNMGNAYFQLDSLPQALVYYRACIGAAPDFFKAQLNLSVVAYTLGDMGACIAAARRALELEPYHAKTMLVLAAAYRRAGSIAESVVMFEDIAGRYPDMEEPYVALGEMYRDLDDAHEAITWLLRYPSGGPNQSYVWLSLADLFEKQQESSKALFYLQQAASVDRSRPWLMYRMIELHQRTGSDLVALETAREAIGMFPDNADIPVLGGTIAFNLERYDESEYFYTRAAKLGSPAAVVGLENIRQIRKSMTGQE